MRKSISALAACLLLSGVVIAGCGGGDEGATTAGGAAATAGAGGGEGGSQSGGEPSDSGAQQNGERTSESKSEFVAEANAACTKQRQQLRAQLRQLFKSGQSSQQAALRRIAEDAIAPAMEAEAEELRALGAPPGDEEQVEAIVAALDAIVAEAREDPTGLVTNPSAFQKVQTLAREYGIGACGRAA